MQNSVPFSPIEIIRNVALIALFAITSLSMFPAVAAAATENQSSASASAFTISADFNSMSRIEKITELQRVLALLIDLRTQLMSANLEDSSGTVTVSIVPLLSGGVVRSGESVPVSYLQVRNTSDEAVTVTGFTLAQKGTASADIITSLSVSDNLGASRATSTPNPFKNGSGFVPTFAAITPGGFKIFTIKATAASNAYTSYGKDLKLEVTNVKTNGSVKTSYPLPGTTWTIGF